MTDTARQNDTGTAVISEFLKSDDTALNVSSATTMTIYLQAPSGTVTTHAAALYTDGADGKISFDTEAATLDEVGEWQQQGYVVLTTWTGRNEVGPFRVTKVLS